MATLFIVIILAHLTGKAQVSIFAHHKVKDFGVFKSFTVEQIDSQSAPLLSPSMQSELHSLIVNNLLADSLTLSKDSADLHFILFQAENGINDVSRYETYLLSLGHHWRAWRLTWAGAMNPRTSYFDKQNYEPRSIIIGAVDTKKDRIVWEGIIKGRKVNSDKDILRAITKLMEYYPPPAAKKIRKRNDVYFLNSYF